MAKHRAPEVPRDLEDGAAYFLASAMFLLALVLGVMGVALL